MGFMELMKISKRGRDLPDDVLVNILSRLPMKSILQLKSVCKDWFRVISSPCTPGSVKYIYDQRSLKNNPRFGSFWQTNREETSNGRTTNSLRMLVVDLLSNELHGELKVDCGKHDISYASSSGGLLCFTDSRAQKIDICNPCTHEFVTLPTSPNALYPGTVGIGYLPSTNQYKIVRWFCLSKKEVVYKRQMKNVVYKRRIKRRDNVPIRDDHDVMGCEVFTLTDGQNPQASSWRVLENLPRRYDLIPEPECVNGVMYWLIKDTSARILAFDLAKGEFTFIVAATGGVNEELNLVGMRGHLCLIDRGFGLTAIWMLDYRDTCSLPWVIRPYHDDQPYEYAAAPPSDPTEGMIFFAKSTNKTWYYKVQNDGISRLKEIEFQRRCVHFDSFFSFGLKRRKKMFKEMNERKRVRSR